MGDEKRGLKALLQNPAPTQATASEGGKESEVSVNNIPKTNDKDYVLVGLHFYPEDAEYYRNFLYFLKKQEDLNIGHKEALRIIMDLVKEKYGPMEQRPPSQIKKERTTGRAKNTYGE